MRHTRVSGEERRQVVQKEGKENKKKTWKAEEDRAMDRRAPRDDKKKEREKREKERERKRNTH